MDNSRHFFDILGVEPNEEFRATGQNPNTRFRITPMLNVEWHSDDEAWMSSGVELRWFVLGRYSNGKPLSIIKMSKGCQYKHCCHCCRCQ